MHYHYQLGLGVPIKSSRYTFMTKTRKKFELCYSSYELNLTSRTELLENFKHFKQAELELNKKVHIKLKSSSELRQFLSSRTNSTQLDYFSVLVGTKLKNIHILRGG